MRSKLSIVTPVPSLILSAVLAALLSACGGGGDNDAAMSVQASSAAQAADAEAAAATPDMSAEKARDKPRFGVTDLGTVQGIDINDHGAILLSRGGVPSVIRRNGVEKQLPTGCIQQEYAINDRGAIVGAGSSRPVMYAHRTCFDLGTLGGTRGYARDVNDRNQVTGAANLAGDTVEHAFLYSDGVMHDLGSLNGASSAGYGISGNGLVAGTSDNRAFLYRRGTMINLGTLGNATTGYRRSAGYAVNNAGQVVGVSSTPCKQDICVSPVEHAFLYQNGTMRDIDTLNSWSSLATAINNDGVVVGWSTNNDEYTDFRAFVYRNGKMQLLNDLLDQTGKGWTLLTAEAINDDGEIIATALYNGAFPTHAVVLKPSSKAALK